MVIQFLRAYGWKAKIPRPFIREGWVDKRESIVRYNLSEVRLLCTWLIRWSETKFITTA
jgi:hypothetical protein